MPCWSRASGWCADDRGRAAPCRAGSTSPGATSFWAHTDRYIGKVLVIEAGKRLSLQRHEIKDKSIFVTSGRLRLYLEDDDGNIQVEELTAGAHRHVPTGRIHRYEAIERTELMEVSTPELDDVVRIEDDFGREGTNAP